MKRLIFAIAVIAVTTATVCAQRPILRAITSVTAVGYEATQAVKKANVQAQQSSNLTPPLLSPGAVPVDLTTDAKSPLSEHIVEIGQTISLLSHQPSELKAIQTENVTYKKEKTSERRGNGYITMYNLMVTNHSDKDLYVFGSVHIIGEVEQEGRHFAGSVPAHSTKSLLTTIDEDFNGVKINWQDDM